MNTFLPLEQLSAFSRRSFSTREQVLDAVLQLVSDFLGVRTIYLSNVSQQEDLSTLMGAYFSEGGLALKAGMQLPLSHTFCALLLKAQLDALVLNDIYRDPVAQVHPFAQAFPMIKSYIGVPVRLTDGTLYGTLCALDPQTQNLSAQHPSFLLIVKAKIAYFIFNRKSS